MASSGPHRLGARKQSHLTHFLLSNLYLHLFHEVWVLKNDQVRLLARKGIDGFLARLRKHSNGPVTARELFQSKDFLL
jgi:hypothetical protein